MARLPEFPYRRFEYQLVLASGEVEESRGYDDVEVFDLDCEDLLGVLVEGEQLILFEDGKPVQQWEFEGNVPVCNDYVEGK